MLYLLFRALHIIGFVAWFAGMFYIWRLFVYHAESDSEAVKATLDTMAEKLYRIIMVPASIFTLACGLATLGYRPDLLTASYWIYVKLALVGGLFVWQWLANSYRKRLLAREVIPSRKFRLYNELPTLILVAVVLLAVFKPF
jgi:putative membrane protein